MLGREGAMSPALVRGGEAYPLGTPEEYRLESEKGLLEVLLVVSVSETPGRVEGVTCSW
jgi:hypothetical protein